MTTFGLTSLGFLPKSQQQIISEIQTELQNVFGQNINLGPESNFGQIVGIFSEREALLWQLAQAVYSSQYPGGAEGTSVDNILALNNLRRLLARPTRTASAPVLQTNGITLYPLLLRGTPGTAIPSGSLIQTSASPPLQFKTNSTVVINAAVNAIQGIFLSNSPTSGAFSISIVDSLQNTLTTPAIPYNAQAGNSLLNFSGTPAASSSFKLVLTQAGVSQTTGAIITNAAFPTAGAIQTAINALAGYSAVTVTGSAGSYIINWGPISNPVTTITANTTTVSIVPVDSVQSAINNLVDLSVPYYPFTDATVTQNASGFNVNFGILSPIGSNPSSAATPEPLFLQVSNSLMNGLAVTNIQISNTVVGAPAQVSVAATCTVDGPNFVAAGSINTIGSPVSGWDSVVNQLDCITGAEVENDTQALVRRSESLNAQANGPLLAIIEKVKQVPNVTQVLGFQNLNNAALQVIFFNATPSSGSYVLNINALQTPAIPYNATAGVVQTAIRTIPGLSNVLVSGNQGAGFTVDFNGSFGGQDMPIFTVTNDTTIVGVSVEFGRPGHSVEIVVQGGSDADIANSILSSKPAGIQTFGNTGPIQVFDSLGNSYLISFSRPTQVAIYVTISMITDTYNVPGNPGSGINPQSKFLPSSISTIQDDIVNIGNATPIGGTVIGFGSNGLIGAFNAVAGILSYQLFFGTSPNPLSNSNISLLPEEVATFETFLVAVQYS